MKTMKDKARIKTMTFSELENYMTETGEKKFRAKQVFEWLHKGVRTFEEMSNLPKALREKLAEEADPEALVTETVQVSQKDGTRKYLFRLSDGQFVESVLMKYSYGNTVCISTQAGCRMGCAFCASCEGGLIRNLTAGEILDQVLAVSRDIGQKVDHVVVMGVGEPFDNYENLARFLKNVHDERGFGMSFRSITVSTCGILPKIRQFAEDFPQVTLAISLHASNEQIRAKLMPVDRTYPYDKLLETAREYVKKTNKRITFEYILIDGVNDSTQQAEELARQLRGLLCHINLIPFNEVLGRGFSSAKPERVRRFQEALQQKGFEVTVRRELGSDIDGACGQLRAKKNEQGAGSWKQEA